MKKILITLALSASALGFSQREGFAKNEVKFNILNTIALGSVEVGYERFLDEHQSVGAEVLINDTYNMSLGRQIKDFDTNSFALTYNYYIGPHASGIVISPMLKFRFGDYQETSASPVIDMDSFIIGLGAGYKWNFGDRFAIGPYANIGRNFSKPVSDEFTAVEFNAGFSLGFRF